MLRYPIKLTKDEDTLLVTSPDFPELTTFGENREEAIAYAVGAFEETIAGRIHYREEIPKPSKKGDAWVELPIQTELTVELYRAMRKQKVGKANLAKRLNCHLPQVDRLLDLNHRSRIDLIEAAFRALGLELGVKVTESRNEKTKKAKKAAAA